MISKKKLLELSEIHSAFCVSIFIPTHRADKEANSGKDTINLKNQLKDIKFKLGHHGMREQEIEKFLKPVNDLVNDNEFWRHQSDGLAIFMSDDLFEKYSVPVYFEEFNYLSNEFYLKPLIPLFNGDGLYYLLTLKIDEVKLYEGTRNNITEIMIYDLIPSQLEDTVGYDYEQKSLQSRSQQGNKGKGMFHGRGDRDSDKKNELVRYFRDIDKGLMTMLHDDQKPPLVISCLDYHFPIYQEVNTHQNLFSNYISGNPADKDVTLLHEESWELVQPYFSKTRQEKFDQFLKFIGTGRASSDITEILPAAIEGKVDTLFIENRSDIFGIYNPSAQDLIIQNTHRVPNVSLMNLVAMKALKKGGTVYLFEKKDAPDVSSNINALFRY
ncbi:MAG: hypothetical protein IPL55_19585 [Saprospiraceae bacterium]|nr:hypothetical protein [Saprospiraceae bacterium]